MNKRDTPTGLSLPVMKEVAKRLKDKEPLLKPIIDRRRERRITKEST